MLILFVLLFFFLFLSFFFSWTLSWACDLLHVIFSCVNVSTRMIRPCRSLNKLTKTWWCGWEPLLFRTFENFFAYSIAMLQLDPMISLWLNVRPSTSTCCVVSFFKRHGVREWDTRKRFEVALEEKTNAFFIHLMMVEIFIDVWSFVFVSSGVLAWVEGIWILLIYILDVLVCRIVISLRLHHRVPRVEIQWSETSSLDRNLVGGWSK